MQVSSQFGGLSNGIKCLLRTEVTRRKDRFGGMGQTTAVRWIALVFRLFSGAQPILETQTFDAGEFSFVVGDNHAGER